MQDLLPEVSIVMPVCNGGETVQAAIESIQHQTFHDWEFIIVDDGSTDNTADILKRKSEEDSRIKIIRNKINMGLSASLNRGCKRAKGQLIARMDADDISLPTRLEKQFNFLKEHDEVSVLGTAILAKDDTGKIVGTVSRPSHHKELQQQILYKLPFFHPTVMMRRTFLEQYGWYDENLLWGEDYELWSRSIDTALYANLSEPLLHYAADSKPSLKRICWGVYTIHRAAIKYGNWRQRIWCPLRFFLSSVFQRLGLMRTSLVRSSCVTTVCQLSPKTVGPGTYTDR